MLKRSGSSSSIPIPAGLNGRSRSSSSIPLPAGLNKRRSRSSSSTAVSRTTVVQRSSVRTNSSASGCTPQSKQKSILKMVSDKKWVAQQFTRVQRFISESGLFDPQYANPDNIKPPSISTFVYVSSVLLSELFPAIVINNTNYKEVIPAHLKLMKYPGVISNSTLKTVNTMHSWPQVIAMFAFLIELIISGESDSDEDINMDNESKQVCELREACLDYITKDYSNFTQRGSECSELNNLIENMSAILGISEKNNCNKQYEEKLEYEEAQRKELDNIVFSIEDIERDNQVMRDEMHKFEENIDCAEHSIDEEIKILEKQCQQLLQKEEAMEKIVIQLSEMVKTQSCSYEKKKMMQSEIENLKRQVEIRKEKVTEYMKVRDKFDCKLVNLVAEIENEVLRWNKSLINICAYNPEVKKLKLREKNFTAQSFLEEIRSTAENKELIEQVDNDRLSRLKIDTENVEKERDHMEAEMMKVEEIVANINNEIEAFKQQKTKLEDGVKNLIKQIGEEKQNHLEQMRKVQNSETLDKLKEQIIELETKEEKAREQYQKFSKKCVAFFINLNTFTVKNLTVMNNIHVEIIDEINKNLREAIDEIYSSFDK